LPPSRPQSTAAAPVRCCVPAPAPEWTVETVHRYVATTAGISRPIGPHALRRMVGTVGLNQGIPLRDVQRLLRHARPETVLSSHDVTGEALERHASHQVAGFLAGWAG
jgi:site-specific recombinase XerD